MLKMMDEAQREREAMKLFLDMAMMARSVATGTREGRKWAAHADAFVVTG